MIDIALIAFGSLVFTLSCVMAGLFIAWVVEKDSRPSG